LKSDDDKPKQVSVPQQKFSIEDDPQMDEGQDPPNVGTQSPTVSFVKIFY
jgi:hypothetical protein